MKMIEFTNITKEEMAQECLGTQPSLIYFQQKCRDAMQHELFQDGIS